MNPEHEQRLDSLLKDWQLQVDLPPRFESEVWHRIAVAQERRSDFWSLARLFRITCQPKLAFALVAAAIFLGTGLANWQAQRNYQHDMATAKSRYIHSVDPLANTLLTSNP